MFKTGISLIYLKERSDGVGEWASTSFGVGPYNKTEIDSEIHFAHSLGLLYFAFTYHTGLKVNFGEYKVMGLVPYDEPKHVDNILNELMDLPFERMVYEST